MTVSHARHFTCSECGAEGTVHYDAGKTRWLGRDHKDREVILRDPMRLPPLPLGWIEIAHNKLLCRKHQVFKQSWDDPDGGYFTVLSIE